MTRNSSTRLRLKPSSRSRAEMLAEALHERIRVSEAGPGALVGTLEDLRRESGFARATVSEAVRLLRDRGVLEIRPGRGGGFYVAATGPLIQLRHTLLEVDQDAMTVQEAIELRDHLEIMIDTSAARHRTSADVADLRQGVQQMERAESWNHFMQANWRLHERIATICPNTMARAVYVGTLGHFSASAARYAEDGRSAAEYRTERQRVHVDLVDAIAAGDDAGVRAAVLRHNTTHRTELP